jgi:molybdopterin/thiamine biosynthesis adenylyltransferase
MPKKVNYKLKLTDDQQQRFSRQLIIPEIGAEGQLKLARARVMIVGMGGLGSASAYYLAAAGVGHLRIVDHDCVALDNLNRQITHSASDLGQQKVESAARKLSALNPGCTVEPVFDRVTRENAASLTVGCDVIIDATDNLETRHILNGVSLDHNIPFVYGGINGWNGMTTTFIPGVTGCFACLFPRESPKQDNAPVAALGPTAGLVGCLQSMEAIKLLLGLTVTSANRLIEIRGLTLMFREIRIGRNPQCPVCAERKRTR